MRRFKLVYVRAAVRFSAAAVLACGAALAPGSLSNGQEAGRNASTGVQKNTCPGDNGGITLPPGFCATVFADNIGHARHLAVAPNGVVYVNTWSGRYYRNTATPPGGFLVALQDTKGDGHADVQARFMFSISTSY